MGKTYEALKRAEIDLEKGEPVRIPVPGASCGRGLTRWIFPTARPQIYVDLAANVLTRCREKAMKIIFFAGVSPGDGASTTAANVAKAMAGELKARVLLVDANLSSPGLHPFFQGAGSTLEPVAASGTVQKELSPVKVGPGELHLISLGRYRLEEDNLFESGWFDEFLKSMRDRFDILILDGRPLSVYAEARMLCSRAEAVVMVVNAGKTRAMIAVKAGQVIEEAGSALIGVVLNRRKFYIPEWIYRRL